MSLSISGSILEISDVQQIKETFKKREFVLELTENPQYPEFIKFELIQDKCALLDAYKVSDRVTVHFNLKGRKWTDREGKVVYFNSLQAWRMELEGKPHQAASASETTAPIETLSEPGWSTEGGEGDLPF
ncbi:hypothetical protein MNBD_BACTEROID06-929 [hydrothermal vent metagenome]|uniref:DUF3127 domain-containing protein n=1 Tax=hydrothermal vent metagenome TaxID=652676 RepID=A0A3B0U7J3_9ZZZZ